MLDNNIENKNIENKNIENKNFNNKNKPKGLQRIYLATVNSLRALKWMSKNETAFQQELLLIAVLIPLSFFLEITKGEQLALVLSLLFVLFSEIVNTAIEAVVDRIGLERHELSGLAKDLGSAIVTISLIMAILTWLIVLI